MIVPHDIQSTNALIESQSIIQLSLDYNARESVSCVSFFNVRSHRICHSISSVTFTPGVSEFLGENLISLTETS